MKMCTSAVSPVNPDRVVVIWVKGQGQSCRDQTPVCNEERQGLQADDREFHESRVEVQVQDDIGDDAEESRHNLDQGQRDKGQGQRNIVPEYVLSVVGEDQLIRLNDLDTDLSPQVKVKLQKLLC